MLSDDRSVRYVIRSNFQEVKETRAQYEHADHIWGM